MTAQLAAAIDKLTARIARLEKAAKQPERLAYRPSEVAALLGVQAQTVRELIHSGQLDAVDMGSWYLIPSSSVDQLLAGKSGAKA